MRDTSGIVLLIALSACEPASSGAPAPSASQPVPAFTPAPKPSVRPWALPSLMFFPDIKTPPPNPLTGEKILLGKTLFFDKRLGSHEACSDCHQPDRGWADGVALSKRASGRPNTRNTPSLHNVAYQRYFGWDGRSPTLEAQIDEEWAAQLSASPDAATQRIAKDAGYDPLFRAAFGDPKITRRRIVQALASFVRTIRSGNAPYDRFEGGDPDAIDASAQRGWKVFRDKAGCTACHVPPLFTDRAFHNIGIGYGDGGEADPGRFDVTQKKRDRGRFKTPTLRSVTRTAPYFHDGSAATLDAAVDYVLSGGHANPQLDPSLTKIELTPEQRKDLLAFLGSLDGGKL